MLLARAPANALFDCRAEHAKETGSPGLTNGMKLSPQDPWPASPGSLPTAGEKGSEKVRRAAWTPGVGLACRSTLV